MVIKDKIVRISIGNLYKTGLAAFPRFTSLYCVIQQSIKSRCTNKLEGQSISQRSENNHQSGSGNIRRCYGGVLVVAVSASAAATTST